MKILITGASSYVGAKIYADLKGKFDVVGTYNSNKLFDDLVKLDITNEAEVLKLVINTHFDYIVHVAANASGSWCEKNPVEAIILNQNATGYLVNAANRTNSKMIFISSFAAIYPTILYGKTKAKSEKLVEGLESGFIILRPSLILGYSPNTINDRPFNRLLKNIRERHEVSYDISWNFQPTWLKHISEIIIKILERNIINELIPIAVPKIVTRYKYAKDILTPFNIEVKERDDRDDTPCFDENLSKLKELNLPEYTYSEMIDGIIKEIKENFKY